MYTALVLIAVGAVLLIIVACVQIVVGGKDANVRTDVDSKIDRKVDINQEKEDEKTNLPRKSP